LLEILPWRPLSPLASTLAPSWRSLALDLGLTGYQLVGMQRVMATRSQHESKTALLNAALNVIRAKSYAATTIDDICHAAGVTIPGACLESATERKEIP
jgi:hypothetical protein